ncbi:MAG: acylphosphatase [Ruminococcus sp.]|nr:acylphosphatase [Ruminococcus sp.]
MESKKVRRRYHFYGRVQGVGFRYYAQYAADAAGVTGWVRNEYDGTVKMEAQGSEAQLLLVLQSLQKGRYIRIEGIETKDIPLRDDERSFRVRY